MQTIEKQLVWTHPQPERFANYLAICGIDKGVFSTVWNRNENIWIVDFDNGFSVEIRAGKLQQEYKL